MQTTLQASLQILKDYQAKINEAIEDYFDSDVSKLGLDLQGHEKEAFEILREFSLRPGKRLRGALAMYSYDYFSKQQNPSAINLGVSIELIQNYLLIIDDVMDESSMRRGEQSVHKLLETKERVPGRLAEMLAINIALVAQHMAAHLLTQIDETAEHINYATVIFHKNIATTGYGQIDDLYIGTSSPSETQLLRSHELKNSYYTFINPLQCGAALAGVKDNEVSDGLLKIGLPAGVAFQLKDDLLGLFGDQSLTGKPVIDDLREGKYTLLILNTFKMANSKDVEFVKSVLGSPKVTAAQHASVKEIVQKCGAKAQVENMAQAYCAKALVQIKLSSFLDNDAKQFLTEIINYSVNREA